MFSLSNNVIGKIAFGTSHRGNQFEYGKLKDIIDDAMTLLSGFSASDFFPSIGGLLDVVTGLQWKLGRCFKNLDTFFEKVLEEHLDPARPKPQHEDITDVMLGLAKDRTTVIRLEKEHMKAVLLDIFLGAVDTSSVTMIWALAELVKNPRAMKKAQAEIHCKIGGYEIDVKTRVLVNAWAIGRDPKMWKDPEAFIPERFEGIGVDYKGQSFEFLPFGSGRRMCPGINMGIMSVEFTVANLLHCFDWKLPGGLKEEELNMEEEFGLNIRKKVPLKLVATKHNWEENK
ncbi:cytochrome P450, family 71, subfamily B, polypeptide 20 [Actinidia rufa]|uniref:Cytochrome P450, family 71, subfamily B, polypeptide 20 n=1 Tax=Actinidia rufa TaxID=165716 RepID=A0A7J0FT51_9ERIC|nr:cytochrome P450, family 71, subfamily B, polypeptide 20 [Actinidia rufa]